MYTQSSTQDVRRLCRQHYTTTVRLRFPGGKRVGEAGYALEPAVFSNVRDDMALAQEKVFGPLHTIMTPYNTLDEVTLVQLSRALCRSTMGD